MFCNKCGQKLKDSAQFCPSCGAPVSKGAADNPASRPTDPPREDPAPSVPQRPVAPPPVSPPKKRGGLIVGAIIALLVLVFAALLLLLRFDLLPFDLPPFGGARDSTPSSSVSERDDEGDPRDTDAGDGAGDFEDTIEAGDFIADPTDFDGERIGLNGTVTGIFRQTMDAAIRAKVDGVREELIVHLGFEEDDVSDFETGDLVYIKGTFHISSDGVRYFENASVTVIDGEASGETIKSAAGIPNDVRETVSDYTVYEGVFAETGSADIYLDAGGPLVELSIEGGSLNYMVANADKSLSQLAAVSGTARMDGASEIAFSGDDGCGHTASGKIYLLVGGAVAVESSAAGAGGAWSLSIPYTELIPCEGELGTGGLLAPAEPEPDHTQELSVVSSGSTAVMTLRNWDSGQWHDVLTINAAIGSNGTSSQKREGDRCTPAGSYEILFAFGTAARTLSIPYVQIRSGDVWVCDPDSAYYNTLQNSSNAYKDWDDVENLYDKFTKNRSVACICFAFNGDGQTAGSAQANGGSDLFIDGVGSAGNLTSGYGDIKITSSDMQQLLPLLDSSRNPRVVIS